MIPFRSLTPFQQATALALLEAYEVDPDLFIERVVWRPSDGAYCLPVAGGEVMPLGSALRAARGA